MNTKQLLEYATEICLPLIGEPVRFNPKGLAQGLETGNLKVITDDILLANKYMVFKGFTIDWKAERVFGIHPDGLEGISPVHSPGLRVYKRRLWQDLGVIYFHLRQLLPEVGERLFVMSNGDRGSSSTFYSGSGHRSGNYYSGTYSDAEFHNFHPISVIIKPLIQVVEGVNYGY